MAAAPLLLILLVLDDAPADRFPAPLREAAVLPTERCPFARWKGVEEFVPPGWKKPCAPSAGASNDNSAFAPRRGWLELGGIAGQRFGSACSNSSRPVAARRGRDSQSGNRISRLL